MREKPFTEEWVYEITRQYTLLPIFVYFQHSPIFYYYYRSVIFAILYFIISITIIILLCIEEAHGEAVRFFSQDAILYQNGRMSHEKQWNDLHIYVKSGVIVYPQPHIHKGWCIAPA